MASFKENLGCDLITQASVRERFASGEIASIGCALAIGQ